MGTTSNASAAIYCRISKDREGAGLGVQRQEQDCRELAASLGWTVTQVFTDNDISAYSGKRRPQYESLLEQMRTGRIRGVLTWHTDRLHRSPRELESYIDASEKHGIVTQTVKAGEIDLSTPSGRAVARTLGAWARYESEHKSDRITRKKLQLAQDGAFSGGPVPFGWRMIAGEPVIQEPEAAEIQKAVSGFLAGRSIGFIVRELNSRGISTSRGQKWTGTAVRNMLKRPTNAGLSAYRGDIVGPSVFPAIISEDEWRAVSSTLRNPSRLTQNGNKVRHLLAGLMLCGKCGSAMQTSSRSSNQGSVHYYKCKTQGGGHAFQTAAPVEEYIAGLVISILSRPGSAEGLTARHEANDAAGPRAAEEFRDAPRCSSPGDTPSQSFGRSSTTLGSVPRRRSNRTGLRSAGPRLEVRH
ncbi:recombinase family protein [Arthrobacter sp. Soil763]|uniref:recombinase family protein n=1 Tax=Arthrobacter sp. Soil763 TaxID=1736402 RepID=UPI0009E7F92A